MIQYKLYYFNIRGRAELARLVLAAAGQEYEDIRIDKESWPAIKPTTQTGQVPYLEVHNGSSIFIMSQSIAIARFLAKRFNLAGGSEFEQAEVDMYGDQISDLLNEIIKALFESDEKRKEASNVKMRTETLPNSLKIFENKLNQINTGYLVGNSLTWADLYLFNVVESVLEKHPSALDNVSAVKKHYNAVRSLPNIAKWIASRPVTPM